MFGIFKDLFDGIMNGDAIERTLLIIILLCFLFCVFLIVLISFNIFNHAFQDTYSAKATLVGKEFVQSYVSTQHIFIGNMILPQTTLHPADWQVCLRLENGSCDWVSVDREFFEITETGQVFSVNYQIGRFNNDINITDISVGEK